MKRIALLLLAFGTVAYADVNPYEINITAVYLSSPGDTSCTLYPAAPGIDVWSRRQEPPWAHPTDYYTGNTVYPSDGWYKLQVHAYVQAKWLCTDNNGLEIGIESRTSTSPEAIIGAAWGNSYYNTNGYCGSNVSPYALDNYCGKTLWLNSTTYGYRWIQFRFAVKIKDSPTGKWVLQIDAIRLNGMDSTDDAPTDEGMFIYLKGTGSLSQRYDNQWHTTDSYLLADLPSDVTPDVSLSDQVLETGLYK